MDEDSQTIKRAMTFLRMWDCVESKDSEATLIFHSIIKELVKNIYYDELTLLGDDYYEGFAELKYFVHRKLRELVVHKNSSWVDNIETKNKIETLDEVLTKSIYDGITFVEHKYGPNWSNWKWGDAHSKTHKHMLSKSSLLDVEKAPPTVLTIEEVVDFGEPWSKVIVPGENKINDFEKNLKDKKPWIFND